jgi:hypothetical protein
MTDVLQFAVVTVIAAGAIALVARRLFGLGAAKPTKCATCGTEGGSCPPAEPGTPPTPFVPLLRGRPPSAPERPHAAR